MPSLRLDLTTCPPTDSQMTFKLEIVTPHSHEEVGSEIHSYFPKSTKLCGKVARSKAPVRSGSGHWATQSWVCRWTHWSWGRRTIGDQL